MLVGLVRCASLHVGMTGRLMRADLSGIRSGVLGRVSVGQMRECSYDDLSGAAVNCCGHYLDTAYILAGN